jgi:hypothetical protein
MMPEAARQGAMSGRASPAARRAVRYARFTIGYNIVEGVVATVVLIRLLTELRGGEPDEAKEQRALKIIAVTFFALAGYMVVEGVQDLVIAEHPDTSIVGIALTGLSIVVMPWLARVKRRAGQQINPRRPGCAPGRS